MTGPEDRLFAKFRLTGSPRALGKVYDLVAPELLQVAQHLAGDPIDAEDLVQRTFVTAIERARSFQEGERVLPWLLGILAHHAKAEKRRYRRTPDPMKLELRRQLLPDGAAEATELDEHLERGLAALPEEQRSVLTLRLRHGLSAAQIADALGRPSGTVRSQMARGLERLREGLPAGLVAAAVVAFGLPRGLSVLRASVLENASGAALPKLMAAKGYLLWSLAPLAEIVIMKKLALAAVVIAGSLVGINLVIEDDLAPRTPALELVDSGADDPWQPTTRVSTPVAEPSAREVLDAEPELTATSAAATETAAPQFGGLRVTVRDSFGAAVVNEVCTVTRQLPGGLANESLVLRTGVDGSAFLAELPVGSLLVQPLRGHGKAAAILPDRVATLQFELPLGIEVEGVVVDGRGEPVPFADIWLSERWNTKRGYPITRTDGSGSFFLASVTKDNYIGAFARGYGISYLQAPRGAPGEVSKMRIVLDSPGSSVMVEVTDHQGRPLEGVQVLVGDENDTNYHRLTDGSSGPPSPPRRGRTDEQGRVELASLPVGKTPVLAKKRGYGLARDEVEVFSDQVISIRLTLLAEARLEGLILDENESPVRGASVWTGTRHRFDSSQVISDEDGRYALEGLPTGELVVLVEKTGQGRAELVLQLSPGEVREEHIALLTQPMISGTLVDAEGKPKAGLTVVAKEEGSNKHIDSTQTKADGHFVIEVEEEKSYTIFVRKPQDWRSFPLLVKTGIRAGTAPIRLRLPRLDTETGTIRLLAQKPDGTPALGAQVDLYNEALKIWRTYDAAEQTAAFEFIGLAPGTYNLTLRHAEHPMRSLEPVTIEAGGVKDLGDLRFAPTGLLVVELQGETDEARLASLELHLGKHGGGYGILERAGTTLKSSPLAPGKHTLSIVGEFLVPRYETLEIVAGETTELKLTLEAAGMRRIKFELPEGEAPPNWIGAQAFSEDGRMAWSGAAKRLGDGSFEARVSVVPGSYRFEARDDQGREVRCNFDVLDLRGKQPALNLRF